MGPAVRLREAGSRSHGGTARGPFHDVQPTWRGCEGRWGPRAGGGARARGWMPLPGAHPWPPCAHRPHWLWLV